MTAALEGGKWSAARPGRTLPPGKTRYPFYRRLGGPQGRCGRAENLVPTGIRSRTVQPVVSHHTALTPPSPKAKYERSYASTRPYAFMVYIMTFLNSQFVMLEKSVVTFLSYHDSRY